LCCSIFMRPTSDGDRRLALRGDVERLRERADTLDRSRRSGARVHQVTPNRR
jgi:hypothetical protein